MKYSATFLQAIRPGKSFSPSLLFLLFTLIVMHVGESRLLAQTSPPTTIIFVRHAEKVDDSRDPQLSAEGHLRAGRLAEMLKETPVEAIFSTNYYRTRDTVGPLSTQKGLEIQLYDPRNPSHIATILSENKGKTIVICGHSNTVPFGVNELLGETRFEALDESDYGNLFIISLHADGSAGLVHLRF